MSLEQVGIKHRRARNVHGVIELWLRIEQAARIVGANGDGLALLNVDHAAD